MRTSKYTNDPALSSLVDRIVSRELTRKQAAETLGISVETFNSRLARAKMIERLKPHRDYTGDHLFKPDPDKVKAYEDAVAYAFAHPRISVAAVHRKYPDLSYQMLARKVKAAYAKREELLAKAADDSTVGELRQALSTSATP